MKDFNNIEDYPIPEGLEFQESYMQDAFAMYDAEKQKRKRRLLIWWIFSATGFATVLLIGIYFFTKGHASNSNNKHQFAEKTISIKTKTGAQTSSTTSEKGLLSEKLSVEESDVAPPFLRDKKTVKSTAQIKTGTVSTRARLDKNGKINHTSTKLVKTKMSNGDGTTFTNDTSIFFSPKVYDYPTMEPQGVIDEKTRQESELTNKTPSDSLLEFDFTALSSKPARLAFSEDTTPHSINLHTYPNQSDTDTRKHQVFINLGVNTLFGMKELQNRLTFRECIGVSYNYRINPKWAIGAGLEYHSISRISYKRKVGDTTNSDNTTTILNKTTLNYISFLPQMSYQLGTKHQLTAGFGIEYLLTDPGERYEIQNFTSESTSRTNSKLYYSTFNRFNFSASIGYSYQFSPFMSVYALYHFGFTDITKNNTFNNTFDRNSRLQLMLKIKLY